MAEMPLNHLGLVVRYHDIRRGPPSVEALEGVRGVMTWFPAETLPDPRGYLRWLDAVAGRGIPLVVLGATGAFADEQGWRLPLDEVNRTTSRFGWRVEPGWTSTTYNARYVTQDRQLVGFERSLPSVVPPYGRVLRSSADARVALSVEVSGRPSTRSDLIIVGRRGAFVAPGFIYFSDLSTGREFRQWYVNPFELFRQVFDTDPLPKPDTTTLSGRRLYYSHVDGDGWRNLTQIEPYRTRYVTAARVVLEEIVKKVTDLPVTIGPVVGDLDPAWHGSAESLAVAKELFGAPQVEAGIHTYSHPFYWSFFSSPRRAADEKAFASGEDEPSGGTDLLLTPGRAKPRMYDTRPFSLATEVDDAAAFVNALLPAGKRVALLQWSGDTRPFAEAVGRARRQGLANINGGDTRFDREFPSAAWVSALGMRVGDEWQVYASNSNENTYTDLWRDRFYGFAFLSRTVWNTGSPRRLKPFNLYYHMYSGERLSSLNAVLANISLARSLSLAPVEASRFSRIATGFFTTTLDEEGHRVWRVRDRGALQTLRFDAAEVTGVDFGRSRGVVGQRHELGGLYVALDEQDPSPLVALKSIAPASLEPREPVPYLVEARWRVFDVVRDANSVRFVAQGFGPGEFTWRWPERREVAVRWHASSGREGTGRAEHTRDGLLAVRLPQLTNERVEIVMDGDPPHTRSVLGLVSRAAGGRRGH
jgi:hypothetical protein